jgi:CYTH domain-containing protein
MGKEIERKYLIKDDSWREYASGTIYRQGYLSTVKERTVRVRTIDDKGFLTIKGITIGATRKEYEYEIPTVDANEMLDELCEKPIIEKTRYD